MSVLESVFLRHPREQNESYVDHARFAGAIGARMALGGIACMIHAVAPCLFTTTASRALKDVNARLASRHCTPASASPASELARLRA